MQTIVLVIHLILALSLVVIILLQRSEGGALGIGGGGGGGGGGAGGFGGLMSARGTANFLTRTTAVLAACFMCTSILLAILAGGHTTERSILDEVMQPSAPSEEGAADEGPEAPAPAGDPAVPLSD